LLYIWQDLAKQFPYPPQPDPADIKQFDHLLIYNIAKDPPELVSALCRGVEFFYGMQGGGLAAGPTGEYLYVPNVRETKSTFMRFGRFRLDSDGLPEIDDKLAKEPVAVRVKKLAELNGSKGVVPGQVTPIEYVYTFAFSHTGAGHSFYPV